VLKALVMPLLGGPGVNSAYHFIAGNPAALPGMIATVVVVAGFGEEIFFRGYMFERLRRLFGASASATVAIVAITSILFALAHLADQGVPGAEQALITGTVFALIYLFGGSIWPSIVAHASFDLAAVAMIYFQIEAAVAHSVY
jgi:membrane protease YdiL (CAAX protease family)